MADSPKPDTTVEVADQPEPQPIAPQVVEPRKHVEVDSDLVAALQAAYDAKVAGSLDRFKEEELKAAKDEKVKQKKDFDAQLKTGKVEATEEEKTALVARKKSTVDTSMYLGIAVGVLVAVMLVSSAPAAVVIAGLANVFGASAAGVAGTAAAAAIASNVTLAVGTLLAGALGAAGYFAGDKIGNKAATYMKPQIGNREFVVTPKEEREIEKVATRKANVYAAKKVILELVDKSSAILPADSAGATDDDPKAKLESALTAMVKWMRLDPDNKTPEEAINTFNMYCHEISEELDGAHKEKLAEAARIAKPPVSDLEKKKQALETAKLDAAIDQVIKGKDVHLEEMQHQVRGMATLVKAFIDAGDNRVALSNARTFAQAQLDSGFSRGLGSEVSSKSAETSA